MSAGWRFSIEVATAWEAASMATKLPRTRLVLLGSAMVMSPDRGGIFATLLRLTRLGLGGAVAGGRQYVSWIHERDFVRWRGGRWVHGWHGRTFGWWRHLGRRLVVDR